MIYSTFRALALDTLNRADCTTARMDGFVDVAFQRLNRLLDHYVREATYTYTTTDPDGETAITLPADVGKKIIEVYVNGIPVDARPDRTSLMTEYLGYTRRAGTLVFNQELPADTDVEVLYWRNFARPADSASNAVLTMMHPLVLYAALVEAGSYFEHPRTAEWAAQFDRLLVEAVGENGDYEMSAYGGPMVVQAPMGAQADY